MSTRSDHLAWCKARAAEYLAIGDARQAWLSFCADMAKHDETKGHDALRLGTMMQHGGMLSTVAQVRDFVQGFN